MSMDYEDYIDIEGEIVAETDKAWLVDVGDQEVWLPKSQCDNDGNQFSVPRWLAEKKGLE